jgi:hypothetical protein
VDMGSFCRMRRDYSGVCVTYLIDDLDGHAQGNRRVDAIGG